MTSDQPEYLDSRGGVPGASAARQPSRGRRRTPFVVGGVVAGLVLLGGAAWAAMSFFATGPQPAEALPDSTIAYASVDLDPSGGQKIEALTTLRKFPAFKDAVGLDTDDDVREWIFDHIRPSDCEGVDYGDAVEPWLGDRFAVAGVDTGADEPTPVLVLQVSDEDGAESGLDELRSCGGGDDQDVAWAVDDGWALVGESQDVVDDIAAAAADAPLAEDDDFTRWTDEAGDSGIASFYAAPALGEFLADDVDGLSGGLPGGGLGLPGDALVPPEALEAIRDFPGAAATLRFDDGGLAMEMAAGGSDDQPLGDATGAGEAVSSLPGSTVAALGLGFYDGWFTDLVDQVAARGDSSVADLFSEVDQATGLDLPDDVETLTGDGVALAVGDGFDPGGLVSSYPGADEPTGPGEIGLKILGDADDIESVLDRLRGVAGADGGILDSDADDDAVAIGPDADYRDDLLQDGDLGDDDTFQRVVEHADEAAAILYVDLDGTDSWLADLVGDDEDVRANVEPLDAFGLSVWFDGDVTHAVVKVTSD